MSAALNSLILNYETKVSALTDTDTRLEAAAALEVYKSAAYSYERYANRDPMAYGIGSRNLQFEKTEEARRTRDAAKQDLLSYLSSTGGTVLVDMGGSQW